MLSPLNCCDVRKPIGTLGEFPLPGGEREQTEFAALLWTRRTDFHHA